MRGTIKNIGNEIAVNITKRKMIQSCSDNIMQLYINESDEKQLSYYMGMIECFENNMSTSKEKLFDSLDEYKAKIKLLDDDDDLLYEKEYYLGHIEAIKRIIGIRKESIRLDKHAFLITYSTDKALCEMLRSAFRLSIHNDDFIEYTGILDYTKHYYAVINDINEIEDIKSSMSDEYEYIIILPIHKGDITPFSTVNILSEVAPNNIFFFKDTATKVVESVDDILKRLAKGTK